MSPATRPILAVSFNDKTLEMMVSSLASLGASVSPCSCFADAEQLALHEKYSGILIDLTSIIKAKGEEKIIAYTLASTYPVLRVRVIGPVLIPMAMPGDTKQDNSLDNFVNRTCVEFQPRALRFYRRHAKCLSTIIKDSADEERGFTLNISWGGAFIASTHPERHSVGQEMVLFLHELGLEVKVRVCWIQPWGNRHYSGYGVEFVAVDDQLEKALFKLLKHDRSTDRHRMAGFKTGESGHMKAEISSITYRVALTDAQQARLDRRWPDGDPFISYEKMEKLLEPLPVSDLDWSHHSGQYLYFTIYGDDLENTLAEVLQRLEGKLGSD